MKLRRVAAALAAVVAVVTTVVVGEATDTIYVYGDATTQNEGLVVGTPQACVGFEWRGVFGPFDCRDGGE